MVTLHNLNWSFEVMRSEYCCISFYPDTREKYLIASVGTNEWLIMTVFCRIRILSMGALGILKECCISGPLKRKKYNQVEGRMLSYILVFKRCDAFLKHHNNQCYIYQRISELNRIYFL